jgi:hypothetical protein
VAIQILDRHIAHRSRNHPAYGEHVRESLARLVNAFAEPNDTTPT